MIRIAFLACSLCRVAGAATLEKLSVDEMSQKSTLIVKGRVLSCAGEMRGAVIYTRCQVAVQERWKGNSPDQTSFIIPGGTTKGLIQTFTGMPKLDSGQDYVFFLWAGRSGVNQVIGLSQGIFDIAVEGKSAVAQRAASNETMLNSRGEAVRDAAVRINLSELRSKVKLALDAAQ